MAIDVHYSQLLRDGIVFLPASANSSHWEQLARELVTAAERDGLRARGCVGSLGPSNDVDYGPLYVELIRPDGRLFDWSSASIGPYQTPDSANIVTELRPQIEATWGKALVAARERAGL